MAKTLIAFYSRRGENYVNGSIKNLSRGNTEIVVDLKSATIIQYTIKGRFMSR